jgi:hypothetical protein
MSNTSEMTPYQSSSAGLPGIAFACVAGAVIGAVVVAKWLCEETEAEKQAVKDLNDIRSRERIACFQNSNLASSSAELSRFSQISLHLKSVQPLVQSAEKLGYRVYKLQAATAQNRHDCVLLMNSRGNRMLIERSSAGRLQLTTAGNMANMSTLVRQHTVDRTLEHLNKAGLKVQSATLANGDVQILAQGSLTNSGRGPAEIKTRVNPDGSLWVDVAKVQGNRCETIVRDLANAIGAEVKQTRKKDSYFQLPGEPAKTTQRVRI